MQKGPLATEEVPVKTKGSITTGAFAGLGFMGMSRAFLGTALPAVRSSLNLNLFQVGSLPAMLQLGFSIAVLGGGPLSDLFNKKRLLMLGIVLLGGSLILFGVSPVLWFGLIAVVLMGLGGGLIESSSNPLLIRLFPGRESTMMNLHHFFFAAGSLAGPIVIGTVLVRDISWRWAYLVLGCLVFLISVILMFSGTISSQGGKSLDSQTIRQILGNRTFQTLLLLIFCAQGVQNGIAYWMVTFLIEVRGFSIGIASLSLSLFFVCLAVGRVSTSYLITKFKEIPYMLGLLCLLAVALALSILLKGSLVIFLFALCGLSHSGILPISLGVTGKIFSQNPGTPMGMLATAAGLGAMVVPWCMSLVSQLTSIQSGFMIFEFLVLFCIVILGMSFKRLVLAKNRE